MARIQKNQPAPNVGKAWKIENASPLLRAKYGVRIPHNRIHKVLRVNGRAMTQPAKQLRRRWVRYERTHSMSLWHTDWKQLPDNRWVIAYLDDASRLIVGSGVFQDATAEHTIQLSIVAPSCFYRKLVRSRSDWRP